MLTINARKLLNYSTDQLWQNLEGEFILEFQDGAIKTNGKECIYSSYVWQFHRLYPHTPLLKKHHIRDVMGDKMLSNESHLTLTNNALWSVYDTYYLDAHNRTKLLDDLAKLAYEVINQMYNDLTYKLEEYVTSIDVLDFVDVIENPRIRKAMDEMKPTQDSITHVYNEITSALSDANNFKYNQLAKASRSNIVSLNQVLQCVGPRAFLTDIDSNQFNKPILRGYAHGIRTMYDSMIESRSAAKSLAYSQETLQKSEYFSRRQQLICQSLKHLHLGDCGSTAYLLWQVRDAVYENGTKIVESDLKTIAGKYYLDEETNTLRVITKKDRHLIGKLIKIRSIVAGCSHPDPYGICEVCYGETALAVPEKTNIGHAACVCMTEKISQNVLSTKHYDCNAVIEGIVLKPADKKYMNAPVNGSLYFLNADLKNKKLRIIISPNNAPGLTDINLVNDVDMLNISRVSEFKTISLMTTDARGTDVEPVTVCVNKRYANMTHHLLRHIKTHGWVMDSDNMYSIDMAGWDYSLPFLSLPMRHINMGDFQTEIAETLEATMKDLLKRDNVILPTSLLLEFHDLVNKRLSVNLSVLEAVIYSSMVVSATNGDYSLPKTWTTNGLGVMRMLLAKRSVASTMAYERHKDCITEPVNYINTNRLDHPFDSLICPTEALKHLT